MEMSVRAAVKRTTSIVAMRLAKTNEMTTGASEVDRWRTQAIFHPDLARILTQALAPFSSTIR